MNKDKITTIAGLSVAVCASVLGTGVLKPDTAAFVVVTILGAIAVGIWGFYTNKTKSTK